MEDQIQAPVKEKSATINREIYTRILDWINQGHPVQKSVKDDQGNVNQSIADMLRQELDLPVTGKAVMTFILSNDELRTAYENAKKEKVRSANKVAYVLALAPDGNEEGPN